MTNELNIFLNKLNNSERQFPRIKRFDSPRWNVNSNASRRLKTEPIESLNMAADVPCGHMNAALKNMKRNRKAVISMTNSAKGMAGLTDGLGLGTQG